MRRFRDRSALISFVVLVVASLGLAEDRREAPKPPTDTAVAGAEKTDDRAALEKELAAKLTGAVLVGQYSVSGSNADKPPQAERYEIESATRLKGDYWVFLARIKYGQTDLKVPITLKVLWAGDTPVITLSDVTIPGLGTFTARVLFSGDRYAGTWQHGKVGGHLWGSIERADKPEEDKSPPTK